MFKRLPGTLPKDFDFPEDLAALGYMINEKDEIKQIADPSENFNYFVSNNERFNDRHKEAQNICIRRIVLQRLDELGVPVLRLPLGTPVDSRHIPILTSANLDKKKRVIIVFNECQQDLGIWAYREIGARGGLNEGSAVSLVKHMQNYASTPDVKDPPGVIIANLGQLVWWRKGKQAVSFATWDALPRKSAVHGPIRMDEVKNRVPGNEDWDRHVVEIFDTVVDQMVLHDAKLDIIGLSDGGYEVVKYLDANWTKWSNRVDAMVLTEPMHRIFELKDEKFVTFLSKRTRAYIVSPENGGMSVSGREQYGCNTYASGEKEYTECMMTTLYKTFLDYFDEVAKDPKYENIVLNVFDPEIDPPSNQGLEEIKEEVEDERVEQED